MQNKTASFIKDNNSENVTTQLKLKSIIESDGYIRHIDTLVDDIKSLEEEVSMRKDAVRRYKDGIRLSVDQAAYILNVGTTKAYKCLKQWRTLNGIDDGLKYSIDMKDFIQFFDGNCT